MPETPEFPPPLSAPPLVLFIHAHAADMAHRIARATGGEARQQRTNVMAALRHAHRTGRAIIGICATGILIRAVAPLLRGKQHEPPVIAVSPDGAFVVPLLGGHHGANALARHIAEHIGARAVVTTASDARFGIALDEPPPGWMLANPEDVKPFMAALLEGARAHVQGRAPDWLKDSALPLSDDPHSPLRISFSETLVEPGEHHLVYYPRDLVIGVGMARDANPLDVIALVEAALARADLPSERVAAIGTIAVKADEPALAALSRQLAAPVRLFSAEELATVAVPNPSPIVQAEVGTPSVAEAAALLLAGPGGRLLVEKEKNTLATVAVARRPAPVADADLLPGRRRGRLFVVGLGPGGADMRTGQAREALLRARHWVGYDLYLELAKDLSAGKRLHAFALGEEEARVRHAIRLAAAGDDVALLCSGDAAIYAMASPVFELLAREEEGWDDFARRVEVRVIPGVSAFQAASAGAGALIGHDFCAVSLSDLLTPWQVIEKRLNAAARGDFVVALYNPRSRRRTEHLARALEILRAHRPAETPVVIASNVGRPRERIHITTLDKAKPERVDMLSIVLVGAASSRFVRANGRTMAYTPRGYSGKERS